MLYLINNLIFQGLLNKNLTPNDIYFELIKAGVTNPLTMQPFSNITIKRVVGQINTALKLKADTTKPQNIESTSTFISIENTPADK